MDVALALADVEKREKNVQFINDTEGKVVSHDGGAFHMHNSDTNVPGSYHFGVYIEGQYFPNVETATADHEHGAHNAPVQTDIQAEGEAFSRLLTITVAVAQ